MVKTYICRAGLVVLTAANALCAFVSAPPTLMASVMLFDAPGSERQWWAWGLFVVGASIPAWFVAGALLGWVLQRRGWMLASLAVAAAPLVAAALALMLISD
ncbi:MAG TPA: hypothetical protein VH934_23050 [Xanthobacteraceae bacterium]|jgi:hypothetical protein